MESTSKLPTVVVAVCTFKRNAALANLLEVLLHCAERVAGRAIVGVVVVDDSTDGQAQVVAQQFQHRFELGLTYKISGRQNIALARNLAIETASRIADWTAMTDDDCEPDHEWLEQLLEVQRRTGADAVTGPMVRRVPKDSPPWLTTEPFLELGQSYSNDGSQLSFAATFNSMISSKWIIDHPEIRFLSSFGVIGGEDMVFYRTAHSAGLKISYARHALIYENEPPSRANLAYQLRLFFWHGNSSYVTSVQNGVSPGRMFLNGVISLVRALTRPVVRIFRGQKPQLRYCLASILHASGKLVGPFGIRVRHR